MKLNELSPEWVAFTYKIMGKYQKEQGEQEYDMYYDVDIPKITGEVSQHYQSKVVELIEAKIAEEEEVSAETENYNEMLSSVAAVKIYKELLTDLTNLKP